MVEELALVDSPPLGLRNAPLFTALGPLRLAPWHFGTDRLRERDGCQTSRIPRAAKPAWPRETHLDGT